MKKLTTIIFIFSFILQIAEPASAMDIWVIPSEPMGTEKLNNLIKELPEELLQNETHSYVDIQMRNPLPPTVREEISQMMIQAEGQSLGGKFQDAIKTYEQTLMELKKHPNVTGIQRITFHALVKTAELYGVIKDSTKEASFWKKAYAWNPDAKLNPEIYSPKTIAKFKELQKNLSHERQVEVRVHSPRASQVFLDGRKIQGPDRKAKVFPGRHQWAVLIPGSPWQVENFQAKNLTPSSKRDSFVSFVFRPEPILEGNCEKPELRRLTVPAHTRVVSAFIEDHCLRVFDGEAWYDIKGNVITTAKLKSGLQSGADFAGASTVDFYKNKPGFFSKLTHSPWFWLGVGAVAVSATAMIKQADEEGY